MVEEKSILKTILFHNFSKWNVNLYLNNFDIKYKWKPVSLEKIMRPRKERIKNKDYKGQFPIVEKIRFSDGKVFFREEKNPKTDLNVSCVNDLLVSNINFEKGAFAINTFETIVTSTDYQSYELLVPIDFDYFNQILRTEKFLLQVKSLKSGGMKTRARYDFLKQFEIPVPPISEQKAIVQKYQDTINEAEKFEKEAEKLIIFKENYIQNILGIPLIDDTIQSTLLSYSKFSDLLEKWTISPLQSEINEKLRLSKYRLDKISSLNCVTRSWKKKEYKEKKFDYIEIGGINPETEEISSVQLEVSKAPSRATQLVYKGDLIFGMTRPYLKKFAIVDTAHDGFICSSGFQVIQPSENYNLHFILELLKSNVCISQFKEAMTGALYPALNAEQLGNIRIPLPPLPVQNEIVEHINQIKAQVKDLRQQAKELREKAKLEIERSVFE